MFDYMNYARNPLQEWTNIKQVLTKKTSWAFDLGSDSWLTDYESDVLPIAPGFTYTIYNYLS